MAEFCRNGHPWEGNEVWSTHKRDGRPYRKCAACMREQWHRNKERYRKPERDQVARVTKWREDNPEKWAAHRAVAQAIKDGILVRPETCERCGKGPVGKGRIEASHDDYDRPLDVEWLCRRCHGAKDRKHRPERVKASHPGTAATPETGTR